MRLYNKLKRNFEYFLVPRTIWKGRLKVIEQIQGRAGQVKGYLKKRRAGQGRVREKFYRAG
jgi:hypothetical protein